MALESDQLFTLIFLVSIFADTFHFSLATTFEKLLLIRNTMPCLCENGKCTCNEDCLKTGQCTCDSNCQCHQPSTGCGNQACKCESCKCSPGSCTCGK
ncbi:unnamed protein product [Rotaria magnacalcarata]